MKDLEKLKIEQVELMLGSPFGISSSMPTSQESLVGNQTEASDKKTWIEKSEFPNFPESIRTEPNTDEQLVGNTDGLKA